MYGIEQIRGLFHNWLGFMGLRRSKWFTTLLGSALCVAVAIWSSIILQKSSVKPAVPIIFLGMITLTAVFFGRAAGILGTLLSGLIFMEYLFPPLHSLAVHNADEKGNLIWMIVGGLALFRFAPPE